MQICFIIDNSPSTSQTYNHNNPSNNINTNISILDTIKINIQTILNGNLLHYVHNIHLFVTSNPYTPLSSFQHDLNHFRYQLKQIRNTTNTANTSNTNTNTNTNNVMTYPAQTIKYAIKHITKFRILSNNIQNLLGFRQGIVQDFVYVMFFSYGMTLRKISTLQAANLYKYFRSQDKFTHFRLCYPFQNQKDKNIDKYKAQIQGSVQYRKLLEISEKINKGELKNIIRYNIGPDNLSQSILKSISNIKPSLCVSFIFDIQINPNDQFSQYFKNSQINNQNFITNQNKSQFKVNLLIRNDETSKHGFPLPYQLNYKGNQQQIISGKQYPQIQQVSPLIFYIDISKKLTKQISMAIPFYKYLIHSQNNNILTNSIKLIKLQKQLERLNINQILFPVYVVNSNVGMNNNQGKNTNTNNTNNKQYLFIGVLHYIIDPINGNFYQLAITYPNFPIMQTIINNYQLQIRDNNNNRNIDYKKIYKLLTDYYSTLPQYYYTYLNQFFKFMQLQPITYQNLSQNNNNNKLLQYKYKQKIYINQIFINIRKQQKSKLQLYKQQLTINHLNYNSNCCIIYGDLQKYKQYSIKISKKNKKKDKNIKVMKQLVDKISQFNDKFGIKSYFSGKSKQRQWPITRQLQKSGQRPLVQGGFLQVNQSINNNQISAQMPGIVPQKKIKPNISKQKQKNIVKINEINIKQKNIDPDDDGQSIMPELAYQNYFQDSVDQVSAGQMGQMGQMRQMVDEGSRTEKTQIEQQNQALKQYQIKVFNNIYDINSVAVPSLIQPQKSLPIPPVNQMISQNQQQSITKPDIPQVFNQNSIKLNDQAGSAMLNKIYQLKASKKVKRSSSIDYLSQEQEEQANKKSNIHDNSILRKYVISIPTQHGIKTKINNCNIKQKAYEENLEKLKKIGFIKNIDKYTKFD